MEPITLICPISLEEIKTAGITCVGSIYDYDNITKWLTKNSTDPVTNLVLPTKLIARKVGLSKESLIKYADNIRTNTKGWNFPFKLVNDSPIIYDELAKLKPNTDTPEWIEYNLAKSAQIDNYVDHSAYDKLCTGIEDKDDDMKRPKNTSSGFQFITIQDKYISNKKFKLERFDFVHFKNCIFDDCDMSSTRFIGTIFDNVLFRNCSFIGEKISFYKATIGRGLIFDGCTVEYLEKWVTAESVDEIRKILANRLLEGEYVVC